MFNLRKNLFKNEKKSLFTLVSPVEGEVVPLSKVPDPTFSQEMLGPGVAIQPARGRVVSPVNGTVSQVFDTGHAVTLVSDEGVEILIHIGIDTVQLKGEHYTPITQNGAHVMIGDVLIEFDERAIITAGYETITPVVICNSGDYRQFDLQTGKAVKEGEQIISFQLKEEN